MHYKDGEIYTLREINNTMNSSCNFMYKSGAGGLQQAPPCSKCGALMLANEKLIARVKKYEAILKYKNK